MNNLNVQPFTAAVMLKFFLRTLKLLLYVVEIFVGKDAFDACLIHSKIHWLHDNDGSALGRIRKVVLVLLNAARL